MRLIDTDEIEFSVARYPIGTCYAEYEFVSKYQIDNLQEVKAIPIEWITEYAETISVIYDMLEDWGKENGS